jgi:hypothetical protein
MTEGSPFGKYAEGVAAIAALSILFTWVITTLFGVTVTQELHDAFLLSLGYIFGRPVLQAASTSTTAMQLALAAHDRIDTAEATSKVKSDAQPA